MAEAINIIICEKENQTDFVEIENDTGQSIMIGERIKHGRYTKIRITPEDIAGKEK